MATASDVITSALKILGVLAESETPTAAMSDDGLTQLNDFMFAMSAMGVDYTHSSLALADTIPLDDKHIRGLKALLAREMSPMYQVVLGPQFLMIAEDGLRQMQADFEEVQPVQVDNGLIGDNYRFFNINTGR